MKHAPHRQRRPSLLALHVTCSNRGWKGLVVLLSLGPLLAHNESAILGVILASCQPFSLPARSLAVAIGASE